MQKENPHTKLLHLLSKDLNFLEIDHVGNTVLHDACARKAQTREILELLLEGRKDITPFQIKNISGQSPYRIAKNREQDEPLIVDFCIGGLLILY